MSKITELTETDLNTITGGDNGSALVSPDADPVDNAGGFNNGSTVHSF